MRETVEELKQWALAEGFLDLRVAAAVEATGFSDLVQWVEAGFAGQMDYFQKRLNAYRHPRNVLEGVKTIVVLAYPYPASAPFEAAANHGKTARYTWIGEDYHDVIHAKLKQAILWLTQRHPGCVARGVVDTAPLLEREFAELAGIGWRAKNTLVINKFAGSYFFLACLLTDLDLPVDAAHDANHCGSCRRCLDACPTGAFPQAGVLDATKCISYLTIELRGEIPAELRNGMGQWVFGCDICQEVCPWNRTERLERLGRRVVLKPPPSEASIDLLPLFELDDAAFRERFKNTPMWRSKRRGLLRNAAIVLGNARNESALPALVKGLSDPEPLVRGACVWAIRRIDGEQNREILEHFRVNEQEPMVLKELNDGAEQRS